jgi:hypothetical protein
MGFKSVILLPVGSNTDSRFVCPWRLNKPIIGRYLICHVQTFVSAVGIRENAIFRRVLDIIFCCKIYDFGIPLGSDWTTNISWLHDGTFHYNKTGNVLISQH